MSPEPARVFPRSLFWCAAGLAAAVYVASAWWHVHFGALNADEGFYAIATRSVAHGEMPYRDFGFTQPPLLMYANALPLRIAGFGLFAQRTVNGLWAAAALLVAVGWLARRTHVAWAIGLVLLFGLSAPWMYFTHLGKTYGFTTFLTMLTAWAFLATTPGPRRNFILGALAVLGAGTRLPAAPFFGLLWLFASWPGRRPDLRESFAAIGGVIAAALLIALPFWLAAPESARFWIFDFHRASVPLKDWQVEWADIASLAPATWMLAVAGIFFALRQRRFVSREIGVIAAALVTLAANFLPTGAYQEYGVPFLLPLAVASAALLFDEVGVAGKKPVLVSVTLAVAIVAQLFTGPLLSGNRHEGLSRWLPPHAPDYNRALPEQLAAARRVVEQSLAVDAPFIGSNLILAAETGRAVPPELRMGPFSFTVEIPPERAERLHLVTHEKLDAWFADPKVKLLAFFQRRELNYGWSMPSFDQLRPEFHQAWFAPVRNNFATAYDGGEFLVVVRKNNR